MSKQWHWSLQDYLDMTDLELMEWFRVLCDLNEREAAEWQTTLDQMHSRR